MSSVAESYNRNYYRLLIIALLFFACGAGYEYYYISKLNNWKKTVERVQQSITEKNNLINSNLDQLKDELIKAGNDKVAFNRIIRKFRPPSDDVTVFIYDDQELKYWSDNTIELKATDKPNIGNEEMSYFNSAYYEFFNRSAGKYKIRALLFLKRSNNKFENNYVQNNFNSAFKLSNNVLFGSKPTNTQNNVVYNTKKKVLFYLVFARDTKKPVPFLLPFIYLTGIVIMLMWLYTYVLYYSKYEPVWSLLLMLLAGAVHILMITYRLPNGLFELNLFSPALYASSKLLYSLGHLLLATLLIAFYAACIFSYIKRVTPVIRIHKSSKWIQLLPLVAFLSILFFAAFLVSLISGLVLNSKISFAVDNVLNLSRYSFAGLSIVFILMFSLYLLCDAALNFLMHASYKVTSLVVSFVVAQVIFFMVYYPLRHIEFFANFNWMFHLVTLALIFVVILIILVSRNKYSFYRSIWLVLGFSAYSAIILQYLTLKKEEQQRIAFADKIETEGDLLAEFLLEDIFQRLTFDKIINAYLCNDNIELTGNRSLQKTVVDRMMQNYFTGYWSDYNIQISIFNQHGYALGNPNDSIHTLAAFRKIISDGSKATSTPGLYSLKNLSGITSYAGIVDIRDTDSLNTVAGTIIIELNSKLTKNELGYPGLLISQKQARQIEGETYSYAVYKNNTLVSQSGTFSYNTGSNYYTQLAGTPGDHFFNLNKVSYLIRLQPNGDVLVVTKPLSDFQVFLTIFIYIFTLFFLWFTFFFIAFKLTTNSFKFQFDFKTRIQLTVTAVIIIIMFTIGSVTIYNIIDNYNNLQDQKLIEKLSSVLLVIENETRYEPLTTRSIESDLSYKFSELSDALNCDFNIYDDKGFLMYTTQPRVFELGLLAPTINRTALNELIYQQKINFVQQEKIGTLSYSAAYQPIRNIRNKSASYLNLPYFRNEDDLNKEISAILVTLINIYIPVFFISLVLMLVLSKRLASPLELIQNSLSKVRLDKTNQRIEWQRKDEIGALVSEYNRMVGELERSAEKLAQSERESAWREMARQVAHEIKNPLTPMKLSLQHMLRSIDHNQPDVEQKVKRFSENLMEQIDTLSNIATEFSNFAKMPKANNAVISLQAVLRNSTELYGVEKNISIFFTPSADEMLVYADKNQLLRVFSNLLKNAIQAIPQNREGIIRVSISEDENAYTVNVIDNGSGIREEQRDRIFNPNFTTKTTGMGLGLAMAKQIIETADGRIWFETEVNAGTTFYVRLPKYKKQ